MSAARTISPLLAAGMLGLIAAVSLSDPAVSAWPRKDLLMHAGPSRIDCSEQAGKTSLVWQTEADESDNHLTRTGASARGDERGMTNDWLRRTDGSPVTPSPYAPPAGAGTCAAVDFI